MITQTAMLAKVLLDGETVSIKNAYFDLGISNIAREIGRSIERKFNVTVSKLQCNGKHRGGGDVYWFEYRLNPLIEENKEGIELMKKYVEDQNKK